MNASDLTAQEQTNVRGALHFLRNRCNGWKPLSKVLHYQHKTLARIANGHSTVTPALAFRVARFAAVSVDDALTGKFPPPDVCPRCGFCMVAPDAPAPAASLS